MFLCITETSTIFFPNFWQYPPYFAVNSFKYIRQISAKYPPNFRQYAQCFADNLHITMTSFPYFLLITLSKFVHYVDHIYVILFITLTEFTQSVNNTVFCGVGFQIIHSSISPNLWSFGNRCYLRTR